MSATLSQNDIERVIHLLVSNPTIGKMLDKEDWERLGAIVAGGAIGGATGITLGVILKYAIFTTTPLGGPITLIPATLLFLLGGIAGQNRYDELVSRHRQNVVSRIVALPGGNRIITMNDNDAVAWVTEHAADIIALIKNQKGL